MYRLWLSLVSSDRKNDKPLTELKSFLMQTANDWFSAYGQSHQNTTNKVIHWLCVPIIFFSIFALLYSIPLGNPYLNVATLLMIPVFIFYIRLSFPLFVGVFLFTLACWYASMQIDFSVYSLPTIAVILFVIAWIGQFIGHKIEGKKPSFIDDIKFLLIGPAWLIHFIYKRLGIKY